MFKKPEIDKENSIHLVIYLSRVENELVPNLELIFPTEDEIDIEALIAMRDAFELYYTKIDKMIGKV